jgi:trk system potassium uptake protein TrkA
MPAKKFIVIVGCGNLGITIAEKLSRLGNDVVIMDRCEDRFQFLSLEFEGFRLPGDALELARLRQSRIQEADILFAVTNDDNTNFLISGVAREVFEVPLVFARMFDRLKGETVAKLGVKVICPAVTVAEQFFTAIRESER